MRIEGSSININSTISNTQSTKTRETVRSSSEGMEQQRPQNTGEAVTQEKYSMSEKSIIDAIEKANKAFLGADKYLQFSIHEGTKQIMVKIMDKETDEVVKELPPEKILDMVAKMWELAGIIVDRKL